MDFVHYVGEKNDLLLTLGSVLSFITGATNILAVGFSTAPKNCLLSSQYWSFRLLELVLKVRDNQ